MEAGIENPQAGLAWLDELEADVSENLRNIQARLEDLKGTETAATLSRIIDELRGKLKEASPWIKAKLGAEFETLQAWLDKLEADVSVHRHTMRAQLEDLRALRQQQTFPRSSISPVRSLRRHRQRSRRSWKPKSRTPGMARQAGG